MTVYGDLDEQEQRVLRAGLQAAAVAVSASSPGRTEETASEGFAAAKFILESRDAYVSNALVSSTILALEARVHAEAPFPDYVEVASGSGARDDALEALRNVVAMLDDKAGVEEADGFKRWLANIAVVVAEAGKEDQGFLGMRGVMVNDAERAVLKEISDALGLTTEGTADH